MQCEIIEAEVSSNLSMDHRVAEKPEAVELEKQG